MTRMSVQQPVSSPHTGGDNVNGERGDSVNNGYAEEDMEGSDNEAKLEPEQEANGTGKAADEEEDDALVVYHCWLCSIEFVEKVDIIRHLKEWHKDRPDVQGLDRLMKVPVCLDCGVQGPCEHQSGEPGDKQEEDDGATAYRCRPRFLVCSSCPEQFLSPETLRQHRSEAHPDEPSHQCTYCPETFVDHPALVAHSKIHLGNRPYICTQCGNRYSKLSDLKRHERIHSGEKPFQCRMCGQTFTQKSSLEKHARMHARRSGQMACLQCGLLFPNKEDLREHAVAEHEGSSYQCQTCGKMYSEERYLVLHEKSHEMSEDLKPFACSFCDRRFTLQHMLEKHEKKSHLAKREIKCHLCHKHFKRNENLTRHMLSHSGVKNFQCSQCGIGFTEKGSLTRHYRSQHQHIRPHACPICRRAFTRKVLVRKHVERFHVRKAREIVTCRADFFRCRLCLKLLRKSGRRQHERHHRSKGDTWDGQLGEELEPECGDENDLERLLGPEIAKLLTGKGGGTKVKDNDDEEDEEDEEEEEDNNEDDDEDGENDESFEGVKDETGSSGETLQDTGGPVFPSMMMERENVWPDPLRADPNADDRDDKADRMAWDESDARTTPQAKTAAVNVRGYSPTHQEDLVPGDQQVYGESPGTMDDQDKPQGPQKSSRSRGRTKKKREPKETPQGKGGRSRRKKSSKVDVDVHEDGPQNAPLPTYHAEEETHSGNLPDLEGLTESRDQGQDLRFRSEEVNQQGPGALDASMEMDRGHPRQHHYPQEGRPLSGSSEGDREVDHGYMDRAMEDNRGVSGAADPRYMSGDSIGESSVYSRGRSADIGGSYPDMPALTSMSGNVGGHSYEEQSMRSVGGHHIGGEHHRYSAVVEESDQGYRGDGPADLRYRYHAGSAEPPSPRERSEMAADRGYGNAPSYTQRDQMEDLRSAMYRPMEQREQPSSYYRGQSSDLMDAMMYRAQQHQTQPADLGDARYRAAAAAAAYASMMGSVPGGGYDLDGGSRSSLGHQSYLGMAHHPWYSRGTTEALAMMGARQQLPHPDLGDIGGYGGRGLLGSRSLNQQQAGSSQEDPRYRSPQDNGGYGSREVGGYPQEMLSPVPRQHRQLDPEMIGDLRRGYHGDPADMIDPRYSSRDQGDPRYGRLPHQ